MFNLKTNIVKVVNYHPAYLEDYDTYASLGSFRLDLRETMKKQNSSKYFSESPVSDAKNLGCYLFGQPNTWKGVIGIIPEGDEKNNEIIVYVDFRFTLKPGFIKDLLRPVLDHMYNNGIIDGYEFIKEEEEGGTNV